MKAEIKTKFATIRLTESEHKTLNEIVAKHKLKSKTTLIRQLLKNHVL